MFSRCSFHFSIANFSRGKVSFASKTGTKDRNKKNWRKLKEFFEKNVVPKFVEASKK